MPRRLKSSFICYYCASSAAGSAKTTPPAYLSGEAPLLPRLFRFLTRFDFFAAATATAVAVVAAAGSSGLSGKTSSG